MGSWEQLLILWFESGKCFYSSFPFGSLVVLSLWEPVVWGTETLSPHHGGAADQGKSMSLMLASPVVARGLCGALGRENLSLALGLPGGPVHVSFLLWVAG